MAASTALLSIALKASGTLAAGPIVSIPASRNASTISIATKYSSSTSSTRRFAISHPRRRLTPGSFDSTNAAPALLLLSMLQLRDLLHDQVAVLMEQRRRPTHRN